MSENAQPRLVTDTDSPLESFQSRDRPITSPIEAAHGWKTTGKLLLPQAYVKERQPTTEGTESMGLFDTIKLDTRIADRLPGYDECRLGKPAHEVDWASKSLEYPFMETYRITGRGRLEKHGRETEEIPEDEWTDEQRERVERGKNASDDDGIAKLLAGPPTRTAREWWERLPDWHGTFTFYHYFDMGEASETWRYEAQFTRGQLSRITQREPAPDGDNTGIVRFGKSESGHSGSEAPIESDDTWNIEVVTDASEPCYICNRETTKRLREHRDGLAVCSEECAYALVGEAKRWVQGEIRQ